MTAVQSTAEALLYTTMKHQLNNQTKSIKNVCTLASHIYKPTGTLVCALIDSKQMGHSSICVAAFFQLDMAGYYAWQKTVDY